MVLAVSASNLHMALQGNHHPEVLSDAKLELLAEEIHHVLFQAFPLSFDYFGCFTKHLHLQVSGVVSAREPQFAILHT